MTGVRVGTSTTPAPAPPRGLGESGLTRPARAVARAMQQAQTWDELRAAADAVWACSGRPGRQELRRRLDGILCAETRRLWRDRASAGPHAALP